MVLLAAVTMAAACTGVGDPDAADRERASEEANRIAESIELPPGYERLETHDDEAQTPRENQGGGQGGDVVIEFRAPSGSTTREVLEDFDVWLTGLGYSLAQGSGSSQCERDLLSVIWVAPTHTVHLHYRPDSRWANSLDVPYSYDGVYSAESQVKGRSQLPNCSSS
jgi:hypothetical protein